MGHKTFNYGFEEIFKNLRLILINKFTEKLQKDKRLSEFDVADEFSVYMCGNCGLPASLVKYVFQGINFRSVCLECDHLFDSHVSLDGEPNKHAYGRNVEVQFFGSGIQRAKVIKTLVEYVSKNIDIK